MTPMWSRVSIYVNRGDLISSLLFVCVVPPLTPLGVGGGLIDLFRLFMMCCLYLVDIHSFLK